MCRWHGMNRIYFKTWEGWVHGSLNWCQTCLPFIFHHSHHQGRNWDWLNTQISPLRGRFLCQHFPAIFLVPATPTSLVVHPKVLLLACREPGMVTMVFPYRISSSANYIQVYFLLVSLLLITLLRRQWESLITSRHCRSPAWVRTSLAYCLWQILLHLPRKRMRGRHPSSCFSAREFSPSSRYLSAAPLTHSPQFLPKIVAPMDTQIKRLMFLIVLDRLFISSKANRNNNVPLVRGFNGTKITLKKLRPVIAKFSWSQKM